MSTAEGCQSSAWQRSWRRTPVSLGLDCLAPVSFCFPRKTLPGLRETILKKKRHQMFSSEWHNFMKVEVFVLCTCMYMVHTCTVLTHSYCMWKNFWNVRWKLVVTNVFQHNITVSFICALLIYLIKRLGSSLMISAAHATKTKMFHWKSMKQSSWIKK